MNNNFNTLVFLRGFNNYFNRIIKKFDTVQEYQSSTENYMRLNRNFNPNDGVTTEHIENCIENSQSQPLNECDYLLVLQGGEIVSRWFILECVRTRAQQFQFTLRRDVVADHLEQILDAPCYIEKGTLNETDPLIFNSEGMAFNQIKQDEILLQDKSQVPWIVGYIARDFNTLDVITEGHPELDRTKIKGRYNVIQSAAIDSSDLPWKFEPGSKIVGNTNGYRLKLTSGSCEYIVSTTWAGTTHTSRYPQTEDTTILYNSKGEFIGANNLDNHEKQGEISRYTADSDFNIYIVSGQTINSSKNISDWIDKKDLFFKSVPQRILDEQKNADATVAELLTYNNKIIKDGQRYYRVKVETVDDPTFDYNEEDYPILGTYLDNFINSWNDGNSTKYARAAQKVVLSAVFEGVRITCDAITQEDLEVVIPFQNERIHLNDAPYDMFCIPYGNLHLKGAGIDCNKDGSLAIAFYTAASLGSSVVYDLQLLPYCPCPEYITNGMLFDESFGTEGFEYNYIKDTQGNVKSIMIWCNNSSGTFNINKSIEIDRPNHIHTTQGIDYVDDSSFVEHSFQNKLNKIGIMEAKLRISDVSLKTKRIVNIESLRIFDAAGWTPSWVDNPTLDDELSFTQNMDLGTLTITYRNSAAPRGESNVNFRFTAQYEIDEVVYDNTLAVDTKVSDACDMYRLVSPNYNGQFEFSLAKNGKISYFNVDYNYKPFTPYIHVNPNFGKLYGYDWNDARGLICGGDFSLPNVTSAWTDYQINNKNYQNIFDRQIQNMEANYEVAHQQAVISSIAGGFTGTIGGAGTGAMAGAQLGGPYGAIAGAAIGGVLGGAGSITGGVMDIQNIEKLHKEAKDYSNDLYDYNLQNIQAVPYSLAKTSAFTYNNKIWPMIEVYSSTSQEKETFRNKLRYNGMTVMKIDRINNFTDPLEERFVKGQLIRLDSLTDDNHMAEAIFNEINRGVYL